MSRTIKNCICILGVFTTTSIFAQNNAAVEVDTKQSQILGHAGKVKIKAESCAT